MRDYESGPFRSELKFMCSSTQMTLLRGAVENLLRIDPHVNKSGIYNIRSLYFDDYNNRCFYENENGVDIREKFRIRIYNRSPERIKLELKRKVRGKTQKLSCPLTYEQCAVLMSGGSLPQDNSYHPVLQKLWLENKMRLMLPKVIVEYEREPFIHPDGNVRVTFDRNIMASKKTDGLFDENLPAVPVLDTGNDILEVKYDEYFPVFIRTGLQLECLKQSTFSKYYICRKYAF